MKSKTDTTLFSSEASLEGISAEYILISDISEEGAYSEMAGIYRERLKEEGVLSDKVPASSPKLLAELIGSVEYNTHFLGVIPSQKEFAFGYSKEAEFTRRRGKSHLSYFRLEQERS